MRVANPKEPQAQHPKTGANHASPTVLKGVDPVLGKTIDTVPVTAGHQSPAIVARRIAESTISKKRGVTVRTGLQFGLLAIALIAAPLAAQQHQHSDTMPAAGKQQMGMRDCAMMGSMMSMMGQGGGMSMMGQGGGMEMMTTMRYAPSNVLKNKGLLKLSPDQVSRIEATTDGGMGKPGMDGMGTTDNPMMKQMQARQAQLKTAFDISPPDEAAIAAAVMPISAMHGSMMAQRLVTAARVRDILTPVQREQLGKLPSPCMNSDSGMMMKRKMPAPKH
ncbi:MAG: hypothetical protein ABIT20_06695 [Gemmatimonadaceae bacterium]